jgi:hypothetical protein
MAQSIDKRVDYSENLRKEELLMIDAIKKLVEWTSAMPVPAKAVITILIVGSATLALMLLWTAPEVRAAEGSLWPANRTFDGLSARLSRVSANDRHFLKVVYKAGPNGIYIFKVCEQLGISRNDANARLERLEKFDLIETVRLTDVNLYASQNLRDLLAKHPPAVIEALWD